jgi:nicotinate dehydrogenase subunit A
MGSNLSFTLNERPVDLEVDESRKLLWVLRTELEQTGPKPSCAKGLCGACTVLIDGRAVRACITPVGSVRGKSVVTIEGLAKNGKLHPVQQAFIDHDALQCGFCTPGMILTAVDLLRRSPSPSRDEIIEALDRNLCRCGAHKRIIGAVQTASKNRG